MYGTEPLNHWIVGNANAATVGQINATFGQRRTIVVSADPRNTSAQTVLIGDSAGNTVYALSAGMGIVLDIDSTLPIFVSGSGNVQWVELAGIP